MSLHMEIEKAGDTLELLKHSKTELNTLNTDTLSACKADYECNLMKKKLISGSLQIQCSYCVFRL